MHDSDEEDRGDESTSGESDGKGGDVSEVDSDRGDESTSGESDGKGGDVSKVDSDR